MTYLKDLGTFVQEASAVGGKFADALLRAAGFAVSGALAFVDREMEFAAREMKKKGAKPAKGPRPASKKPAAK